ncbi:MAG: sulfatase-like hydrolase/transferase [Desulfobaccales bacterium]
MMTDLPHIILIVMDSVAAGRCSLYGHRRDTTPGLRRLADKAVVYEHCFASSSWTLPSHVSLFSGLYPSQHGCTTDNLLYPGNYYPLPEILRSLGYHTVGISSNYLISRAANFHHGFHEFYEMDTLFTDERYWQTRREIKEEKKNHSRTLQEIALILKKSWQNQYYSYPIYHFLDRIYRKFRGDVINKCYFASQRSINIAKKVFRQKADRRLFLFFNFMQAHTNYNPPKNFRHLLARHAGEASQDELLYEQEIAFLDHLLYDFYVFLERQGLAEETLLIITSDHGEGFREHACRGHVFCVYNEIIHIPLVVKYPAAFGQAGRDARVAQLHDVYATVLEAVQAPLPLPESSVSLLGSPRELALVENLDVATTVKYLKARGKPIEPHMQPCRAVIDAARVKLIEWADGRRELYDLTADPGETTDLAAEPRWQTRLAALQQELTLRLGPLPADDLTLSAQEVSA